MCRDWRRCPSNRGERKRAYQRARYAAKKVEAEHATTTSTGTRGVDVAVAGGGDAAAAAAAAAPGSAAAVAAAYTAPETSTALGTFFAKHAADPQAVAERLNDPDDPLYIDPADTSDSATAARESVVTLLCSSDLSDTAGMDAWVAAECDREHGQVVAAAAMERAKDLHAQTDEIAAVAHTDEVSKAMRTTGRALSVGTGIRAAHDIEDSIQDIANDPRNYRHADALIALDDDRARAIYSGFCQGGDVDAASDGLKSIVADRLVAEKGMSPDDAAAAADTAVEFATTYGGNSLMPEDMDTSDVMDIGDAFHAMSEREQSAFYTAVSVSSSFKPAELEKQENDRYSDISALDRRMREDNEDIDLSYSRVAVQSARMAGCLAEGTGYRAENTDADSEWEDKRVRAIHITAPQVYGCYPGEGYENRAWYNAVHSSLNEVSPRFTDTGQLDSLVVKNSQAKKGDVDEVRTALELYSQSDMEKFYRDFADVDSFYGRTNEAIQVEKSKKRAHFVARDHFAANTGNRSSYTKFDASDISRFVDAPDDPNSRFSIGTAVKNKGKESRISSVGSLPIVGEEGSQKQIDRMEEMVEKFNSLPNEQRAKATPGNRKKGMRLTVDRDMVRVPGKDEPVEVAYIRSTTKDPQRSKEMVPGMTVRVGDSARVTHHEVAHMVDHVVAVNNDMAQSFLDERIEGLHEVNYLGRDNEKVVKDGFYSEYVGKTSYGSEASEINSMGIQVLLEPPYQTIDKDNLPKRDGKTIVSTAPRLLDPEHHDHVLGLLAGTPRTIRYNGEKDVSVHNRRVLDFEKKHGQFNPDRDAMRVMVPSFDDEGNRKETSGMSTIHLFMLRDMATSGHKPAIAQLEWLNAHGSGDRNDT